MAKTGEKRPITRALELLKNSTIVATVSMGSTMTNYYVIPDQDRRELVRILKSINGASGTTDTLSAKRRAATIRRRARGKRVAR